MIRAELLAACDSPEGVAAFFRHLGYAAEPVMLDPAVWESLGVTWDRVDGSHYYHLVTAGTLELFLATHYAPAAANDTDWLSKIQARNKALKIVLVSVDLLTTDLTIKIIDSAGRLRSLVIDRSAPHADGLDRLEAMAADAGRLDEASRTFDRAMDRESLGLRFISRFRQARAVLARHLQDQLPDASSKDREELALLLLSRILFLYFVQRKGWLDGDSRFLVNGLRRCEQRSSNYYDTFLRPLFFGCLNTPSQERGPEAASLGEVPYLNGGLFEPSDLEQISSLSFKNAIWSEVLADCFELFPFSVREDQVDGLHIDPEMLGKVFESLMGTGDRLQSGSFYTPKVVVDILTHRALAEWCSGEDSGLAARLRMFLAGDSITLEECDRKAAGARLMAVRVIDIACGSGAFLLSALHAIERLDTLLLPDCRRSRKAIAESCLFGVDTKSEAVRLCELRLWLAIVAESSVGRSSIEPLPNLDRNILQGNSLLSPLDFLGDARLDVYAEWSREVHARTELLEAYRVASGKQKQTLSRSLRTLDLNLAAVLLRKAISLDLEVLEASRAQPLFDTGRASEPAEEGILLRIQSARDLLRSVRCGDLSFFSFDLHFATILRDGGFPIILGNPPWVRASRIPAAARRQYSDRFRFFRRRRGSTAFQQPDLSLCFMEKSLGLLRRDGALAILMPGKILNAGYASVLRNELAAHSSIVSIQDWSADQSLFDADVFPVGLIVRNTSSTNDVEIARNGQSFSTSARSLFVSSASTSPWSLASGEVRRLLNRIRRTVEPLSEVLDRKAVMGVKTGDNARFLFDELRFADGWAYAPDVSPIPLDRVARCIRGRDVRRWKSTASSWMLLPSTVGSSGDSTRLAYFRPEHLGIKVVWKDLARGIQSVVVPATISVDGREFPVVPNQTTYCLDAATLEEAFFLCALLNSSVASALATDGAERGKDCYFRYFGSTVSAIPIPRLDPSDERRRRLSRLARRGHIGQAVDTLVDEIVSDLYEVSPSELALLGRFLSELFGSTQR
ncbi:MAG TPA: hypothetical protein VHL58_13445 [Thermoanaerobaculia bacterium]|nr:hypothetical protein [Thermoanaerobaculia bacterium]